MAAATPRYAGQVSEYTASVIRHRRRIRCGKMIVSNASNSTATTNSSPAMPPTILMAGACPAPSRS